MAILGTLRPWKTRTHCCGHVVVHDVSSAAQAGKQLLRTQNVSEQNQKHFLCPGHKICVRNKCWAHGQTGKHLCRQQCVRNNASSFARAFTQDTTATRTSPKIYLKSKTIAVYLRYNSLYISLPSSAKQQREMIKFESREPQGLIFIFLFCIRSIFSMDEF